MRRSIVASLVVSIIALVLSLFLIGISLYMLNNPVTYTYSTGSGYFSYRLSYSGMNEHYIRYYQNLFSLGELLFISGVILVTGTLIAHNNINNTERLRVEKIRRDNRERKERKERQEMKEAKVQSKAEDGKVEDASYQDIPVYEESTIEKEEGEV